MKKEIIIIFYLLFHFTGVFSQTNSQKFNTKDPYQKIWIKVDNYLERKNTKYAAKILDSVYKDAKVKYDIVSTLKAELYLLKLTEDTTNNNLELLINQVLKYAKEDKFPNSAIWQSITAQLYWKYYINNRATILKRPRVPKEEEISDFTQWDAGRFFEKSATLYIKSLSRAEDLKNYDISKFSAVLVDSYNDITFQSTLFDLMVFRTLEFLDNDEADLKQKENKFIINDPSVFAPAGVFMNQKFDTKDFISYQWLSLQWYKEILRFHENDSVKDAFINADIKRLNYVYKYAQLPNKKQLYTQALQFVTENFSNSPITAIAAYKKLEVESNLGDIRDYDENAIISKINNKDLRGRINLKELVQNLKSLCDTYPNTKGNDYAKDLLYTIEKKQFSFTTENVVLPNEPSKLLLTYRNVDSVYIRIVKVYNLEYRNKQDDLNWRKELMKRKPTYQYFTRILGSEDYYEHSTEVKINSLQPGAYCILISLNKNFINEFNDIKYQFFQVSNLAYISPNRNSKDYKDFIVNRKTGYPMPKAKIQLFYNKGDKKLLYKNKVTEKDGSFSFKIPNVPEFIAGINIVNGNDTLYENYKKVWDEVDDEQTTTTYFFTDKNVYHPGQTVLYKGIMVRKHEGNFNKVVKNKTTTIALRDDIQNLQTATMTTNGMGSFSGSFKIPDVCLKNELYITNESGIQELLLTPDKKSDIYIEYDTIKTICRMREKVTIQGRVLSYNGKPLDNIKLKFAVTRLFIQNYENEKENQYNPVAIDNGAMQTDKNGSFSYSFYTVPDSLVNTNNNQVYTYEVNTSIIENGGIKQNTSALIRAGYASLIVKTALPEIANLKDVENLPIKTMKLNGQFDSAQLYIKISLLRSPQKILRKRFWQKPDVYSIPQDSFYVYFPFDEYSNEADINNWVPEQVILDTNITTAENKMLTLSSTIWNKNGWYSIEISTKDKNNVTIYQKKILELWDKNNINKLFDPLVVIPNAIKVQPNDSPIINIISGFDTCMVYQLEQTLDENKKYEEIPYFGNTLSWSRLINDEDKGGIALSLMTMKENRMYSKNINLQVPWADKILQMKLATYRDKVQTGATETWKIQINDYDSENISGELLASMYDGSFNTTNFNENKIGNIYINNNYTAKWDASLRSITSNIVFNKYMQKYWYSKGSSQHFLFIDNFNGNESINLNNYPFKNDEVNEYVKNYSYFNSSNFNEKSTKKPNKIDIERSINTLDSINNFKKAFYSNPLNYRTNPYETSFFFPQLQWDDSGKVNIQFTLPDAQTVWTFKAFAHTADMAVGKLETHITSQKQLLVIPKIPKYLLQGDEIYIEAKVANLSDSDVNCNSIIEIVDALTLKSLDSASLLSEKNINLPIQKGQSRVVKWKIHVTDKMFNPVIIKIKVQTTNFSDGEENAIPIITGKVFKTSSFLMAQKGSGTTEYKFRDLILSDSLKTINSYNLMLEFTSNPAWYALLSLPYLMENQNEDAEGYLNQFFASALAHHVLHNYPKLEGIINSLPIDDSNVLFSNIEKNNVLKSILLSETPWVLEAKSESEQRHRILQLFQILQLENCQKKAIQKLESLQLPLGGFSWFPGMEADRFLTQNILIGLGKLISKGIEIAEENEIITKALEYADRQIKRDYDELLKNRNEITNLQLSGLDIQYLYMRSYFKDIPIPLACSAAYNFLKNEAIIQKSSLNTAMKGMLAIALAKTGNVSIAKEITNSLKTNAIKNDSEGMYFKNPDLEKDLFDEPIATQSLLMECFWYVNNDTESVDAMKFWLFKQRNSQCWNSSTANACYAVLLNNSSLINYEPIVHVLIGDSTIIRQKVLSKKNKNKEKEKGTGYFKVNYLQDAISSNMGKINLSVSANIKNTSYGTLFWQYFEEPNDQIPNTKSILLKKILYKRVIGEKGIAYIPVTDTLKLFKGDKLIVHIEVNTSEELDYVEIKDIKSSCYELLVDMNDFKNEQGIKYYEKSLDASVNFFINHLPKGKFYFDYPIILSQSGNFALGNLSLQNMYVHKNCIQTEEKRLFVAEKE